LKESSDGETLIAVVM